MNKSSHCAKFESSGKRCFIWQIVINYEKQARSARHQQLLDGASPGDDVGDVLSLDRNSMHCILSSNKGRSSNGATNMGNRAKRLTRWFLVSGCLGVLVALILMTMAASQLVRPTVLLVLWPSSIAGIADPSTLSDKIIVAMFEFGGNFILYGVIGTLIGLFFRRNPT
jgi:hypothetical protein